MLYGFLGWSDKESIVEANGRSYMTTKLWDQLKKFLARQRTKNRISNGQEQILSEMIQTAAVNQIKESKKQIEIDYKYIKGDLTWEDSTEAKREIGCFELPINPRGSKREIKSLIDDQIVIENARGLALREPFELTTYRVAKRKHNEPTTSDERSLMKWIRDGLERVIEKFITELPDRKALFDEAAFYIPKESAIIFAGTSAIFDPFEFDERLENHSRDFCNELLHLERPVFYVWNQNLVHEQIRSNIEWYGGSIGELQNKYFDHLTRWLSSGRIRIYVGNNEKYTRQSMSIPYVSEDHIMIAKRERTRLVGGKLWHRRKILEFKDRLPLAKWLPNELFESFPELTDFDHLRKSINREGYKTVADNHSLTIAKFIEEQFAEAQADEPAKP